MSTLGRDDLWPQRLQPATAISEFRRVGIRHSAGFLALAMLSGILLGAHLVSTEAG
jgi:hypothetical protein